MSFTPQPPSPPQPSPPQPAPQNPAPPQPAPQNDEPLFDSPVTDGEQAAAPRFAAGWVRSVEVRSLWTGAAAAASSYLLLVVMSVLLLLLALGGVVAGNGGSLGAVDVPGQGKVSAWSQLGQMAVQLTVLGHFGTLGTVIDGAIPFLGTIRGEAWAYGVPLSLLVLGAVGIYFCSVIAERKVPSTSRRQLLGQALVTGFTYSVLVNGAAAIFAFNYPSVSGISVAPVSAVGFWSVVMSLCLGAGVSALARHRISAAQLGAHPVAPSWAARLNLPLVAASVHTAVFAVVAAPTLWIAAAVTSGPPAALTAPLWILNATGYGLVAGHLGGISVSVRSNQILGGSGSHNDEQLIYGFGADAGSTAVGLVWAALALAIVSAAAAGTVILLRRGRVGNADVMSWLPVPGAFLVLGLVLLPLLTASGAFSIPGLASGSASASPAWWFPAVFAAWGVLAELFARFLSPSVIPMLPGSLTRWARVGVPEAVVTPATAAEPLTPVSGLPAAVPGSQTVVPPDVPAKRTLSASDRKRRGLIVAAAGLAVVLGVGGVVAVNVIKAGNGPGTVVREYLQALVEGDAEKAIAISDPGVSSQERALLNNRVYQAAGKRMDGFTILSTVVSEDAATVTVEVRQDGRKQQVPYTLTKGEAQWLDDDWQLTTRLRTSVMVTADSALEAFTVNGLTIDSRVGSAGTSMVKLPAFPGEYTVGIPAGQKFIIANESRALVSVDPLASAPLTRLEVGPSRELETAVATKIEAVWTACAASTELIPRDCPFEAYAFGDVRSITWTIKEKPRYAVEMSYGGAWRIVPKTSGAAEVSFERNSSFNRSNPDWKRETRSVPFRANGTVDVASGEVALELSRY